MVEASFSLLLDPGDWKWLDEAAIATALQTDPALLEPTISREFDGVIAIKEAGQPDMELADDLEPIVYHLCFGNLPALLRGEPAQVHYWSYYGQVTFTPESETITVADTVSGLTATYPKDELTKALFNCGVRFYDFIVSLDQRLPDYAARTSFMAGMLEPARQALAAAGLL